MNHDEYIQLVKGSEVFRNLSEDLQNEILKAEGADKDRYIKIFFTERNGILAARKELIETVHMVTEDFGKKAKKLKKEYVKGAETRQQESDVEGAEALLDSIK